MPEVDYPEKPKRYYEEYRLAYEKDITDREEIEKLLKASYINELEDALDTIIQKVLFLNMLNMVLTIHPFSYR